MTIDSGWESGMGGIATDSWIGDDLGHAPVVKPDLDERQDDISLIQQKDIELIMIGNYMLHIDNIKPSCLLVHALHFTSSLF